MGTQAATRTLLYGRHAEMIMNFYSTFSTYMFKCALQGIDIWVRSDISMYVMHV